ncbi:FAD-dependent oxidoreductase [Paramaledivibacter caminithermalis]|uniref:Dehydrogenase (Flavoprotein) n=1 Tax=Paramaledivibacter caminithermalis (strain DSM 15212 / CIP 107654 / DViRD3) TaxID=1121301 RepID=A0A1M6PA09_PARC5|nr:NAD(P)/FAD-dependent oxidoreductase [Paramaledivibacter caminithermalis]SHK04702.1 Dehydrogenase (flavoprotein) [Paramaledivibacter caminithermalis DSM 15212]
MKVAIIGAGLGGLSCALEFQKHGINPDVYEKNDFIGERHSHVTALLNLMSRPAKDPLVCFKNNFDIELTPLTKLKRITHISPNKKTTIEGELGYLFVRGKEQYSIKNQLYSKLKKPKIQFNKFADYEELSKKYDYVIIATGNTNFTEELGCSYRLVTTYLRGAIILGNFDPNELIVWINKDYSKDGYAYLTPFSNKKASLVLIVTDVNDKQVDNYWERFLLTENIESTIIEEFKLKHSTGYTYPNYIDNIYFVGNSRGGIEPFLGFGQINSITDGVLLARAITEGKSYDKLLKKTDKNIRYLYEFRKAFNRAANGDYDKILSVIGAPVVKQLMYDSQLNVIKVYGTIFKYMNRRTKKRDRMK